MESRSRCRRSRRNTAAVTALEESELVPVPQNAGFEVYQVQGAEVDVQNPAIYAEQWIEESYEGSFVLSQDEILEGSYVFSSDDPDVFHELDNEYVYVEMASVQAGTESDDEIIDVVNDNVQYFAEDDGLEESEVVAARESSKVRMQSCLRKRRREEEGGDGGERSQNVRFAGKFFYHNFPSSLEDTIARMSMYDSKKFIRRYIKFKSRWDRKRSLPMERKARRSNAAVGPEDLPTEMKLEPREESEKCNPWKPQFRCEATLYGHQKGITRVRFSPDGLFIASASNDSTVKVWSFQNEALENTYLGHSLGVNDVAWCPRSRLLLSASSDRTLMLWDRTENQRLWTFEGHEEMVLCCAIDPVEGRRAASGSADEAVRVWDLEQRRLLFVLNSHQSMVVSLSFYKDGVRLVSAGFDGHAFFWDTREGELVDSLFGDPALTNPEPLTFVQFTRSGNLLTSNTKSELVLWDLLKRSPMRSYAGSFNDKNFISASIMVKHGYPSLVISGSEDDKVRIWDFRTMQLLQTVPVSEDSKALALDVHPRRFLFASAGAGDRDTAVRVWMSS
ncbi:hypothetical protein QR680_017247 [Steinernema hermaphroditum]|uniref:WDR5-like beta-propeller domain-containing protein n=1 Tax=Steinernema hermaphroditum TaxID=289476 RepID=A0AA39HEW1_9BILA|nr:hypothetical protein QR680_017247 [Steinernema hermaphroditum]